MDQETRDLLLIINNDNCYFANLSDMYNGFLEQDKADILKELYMKIGRGTVAPSSLREMRDTYNDLLADFHCADKHIFTVEFSLLDIDTLDRNFTHTLEGAGLQLVFHEDHVSTVIISNYYSFH
nr:hypothetical protein BaRGS_010184 [Batillaria attramentaria]